MSARVVIIYMIMAFGWSDNVDRLCNSRFYNMNISSPLLRNATISAVLVIRRIRGINAYTCGHAVTMFIWTGARGNATAAITRPPPVGGSSSSGWRCRAATRDFGHRRGKNGRCIPRKFGSEFNFANRPSPRRRRGLHIHPPPTILNIYCMVQYYTQLYHIIVYKTRLSRAGLFGAYPTSNIRVVISGGRIYDMRNSRDVPAIYNNIMSDPSSG